MLAVCNHCKSQQKSEQSTKIESHNVVKKYCRMSSVDVREWEIKEAQQINEAGT